MAQVHKAQGRILLEISEAEANTLYIITQFISGSPGESRRGHTEAISDALREAGLDMEYGSYHRCVGYNPLNGSRGPIFAFEDEEDFNVGQSRIRCESRRA